MKDVYTLTLTAPQVKWLAQSESYVAACMASDRPSAEACMNRLVYLRANEINLADLQSMQLQMMKLWDHVSGNNHEVLARDKEVTVAMPPLIAAWLMQVMVFWACYRSEDYATAALVLQTLEAMEKEDVTSPQMNAVKNSLLDQVRLLLPDFPIFDLNKGATMSRQKVEDTLERREVERVATIMDGNPLAVFVFGSNRHGQHGGGAAYVAFKQFGAVMGVGEGLRGRSYALPTKATVSETLTLEEVKAHVDTFLAFAAQYPRSVFAVTRVGCGLAGFKDSEIAPLFKGAPRNCELPEGWRNV